MLKKNTSSTNLISVSLLFFTNLKTHYFYTLCCLYWGLWACKTTPVTTTTNTPNDQLQYNDIPIQRIAFGSCAKQDLAQTIWKDVVASKPDLWVWLGDNIYDTPNATVEKIKTQYAKQLNHIDYKLFLQANIPIVGTWDDNDYGMPDGGKRFVYKKESQAMLLDFLGVPADAPQRKREGVYASYVYGKAKRQVKVILLDARYFRDDLKRDTINKKYIPTEGDVLGEAQWQFLETELRNSQAQVHIIACGIQFLSDQHPFEKWANLPQARQRFFDLLQKYTPANTILLSGDRHIGEISYTDLPNYKHLYEITSSGITHVSTYKNEPNPYRLGNTINQLHYGMIEIDWKKRPIQIKMKLLGANNEVLIEKIK
jgi:alkaline phosphatase D